MQNKILNDLFDYANLKIYQSKEGFKFSIDSILLAEYVKITKTTTKTTVWVRHNNKLYPKFTSRTENLSTFMRKYSFSLNGNQQRAHSRPFEDNKRVWSSQL